MTLCTCTLALTYIVSKILSPTQYSFQFISTRNLSCLYLLTGYKYSQERVTTDGHVITSRGPGTAMQFALACASAVTGENMEEKIGPAMLFQK